MKSSVTKTFRKRLNGLPTSVQEQAARAYALWQEDPHHPSLQFKGKAKGRWSIWVNGNWRITFEFRDGNAYVLDYENYH
jgi:plasmid maintenance system killer protein